MKTYQDNNIGKEVKKELIEFYNTSNEYLEDLKEHDAVGSREYLKIVVDSVHRYLKSEDISLLEVGCGTGYSSFLLSKIFSKVVGADISSKFIDHACRNYDKDNLFYRKEDAANLSFKNGEFDVVASFDFIEHCYDVTKALEEMCRVLAPNGLIIILSPNLCSFFWPLRNLLCRKKHIYEKVSPGWLLQNLAILIKKSVFNSSGFIYKRPLLTPKKIGLDFDSIYLSHPQDIKNFLESNGFVILKARRHTLRARISEKLLGSFAPSFIVVAQKVKF
jgi:ubiquinone/menaquinone biosynthesis C-methylase UbiE